MCEIKKQDIFYFSAKEIRPAKKISKMTKLVKFGFYDFTDLYCYIFKIAYFTSFKKGNRCVKS